MAGLDRHGLRTAAFRFNGYLDRSGPRRTYDGQRLPIERSVHGIEIRLFRPRIGASEPLQSTGALYLNAYLAIRKRLHNPVVVYKGDGDKSQIGIIVRNLRPVDFSR